MLSSLRKGKEIKESHFRLYWLKIAHSEIILQTQF